MKKIVFALVLGAVFNASAQLVVPSTLSQTSPLAAPTQVTLFPLTPPAPAAEAKTPAPFALPADGLVVQEELREVREKRNEAARQAGSPEEARLLGLDRSRPQQ